MLESTFRQRSGRVIGLSRLMLAAVFLGGIWLVPAQARQPDAVYVLFLGYAIWSAIVLYLTWSNWWFDFKVGVIAHAIDLGAFGVMVYYTEGYTSPFHTFFVFLVLSAAIKWGQRETLITAGVALIFYLAAGGPDILFGDTGLELQQLLIRSTYLVVLSMLLIWFGANQPLTPEMHSLVEEVPQVSSAKPPIEQIVKLAKDRLKASRILFAWWQLEEPWLHVSELTDEGLETQRFSPTRFTTPIVTEATGEPFLFDLQEDRALVLDDKRESVPRAFSHSVDPGFSEEFGLTEGLVVRVRAREYEGELFALGISGMCADDLLTAALTGDSLARLFDRSSALAISEEAAVGRAKASLARDLHDSVVQVLAGTSFRLEALRSWIKAGRNADTEIDALKTELANEQRKVREFIAMLRSGRDSSSVDLRSGMRRLVEELQQRWDLECELKLAPLLPASSSIEHEIQQIIREAAANAKRHGGATKLKLDLNASDDDLSIKIADNGKGLVGASEEGETMSESGVQPWSVHERVKRLGGALQLRSSGSGTELWIQVPIGPDR